MRIKDKVVVSVFRKFESRVLKRNEVILRLKWVCRVGTSRHVVSGVFEDG